MWRSLHDAWWRLVTVEPRTPTDRALHGILEGAASLYGLGVRIRNAGYDRRWLRQVRLPCTVISVGNLSVGGSGKTACVEYLAAKLMARGTRVGVLSRGYGGGHRQPYWLRQQDGRLLVDDASAPTHDHVPDEPYILATRLAGVPIVIGRRRERTGQLACERLHTEVLILDDGLQYRRLHRDCEIVLVNARMPLGGWPLFPRGPMREPLDSLKRADVVMVTKADQSLDTLAALQERLHALNPNALLVTAVHEPESLEELMTSASVARERLHARRVALLSGIGDPEGFEQTVQRLGATVISHAVYPDHHRFSATEWSGSIRHAVASGAEALVTTEKDAVRLRAVVGVRQDACPVWVLRVRMALLNGEELLDARLARVLAR